MPDAQYMVMVPTVDNLGNQLVDVAAYAHQWLFQVTGNQGSWIEPGKIGLWRDDAPESYSHLITIAPDTPEMDSAIKQLAVYVAEVCNQWGVFCVKQGNKGPVRWEMNNPTYRPGEPAIPVALKDPEAAQQHAVDPTQVKGAPAQFGDEVPPPPTTF